MTTSNSMASARGKFFGAHLISALETVLGRLRPLFPIFPGRTTSEMRFAGMQGGYKLI